MHSLPPRGPHHHRGSPWNIPDLSGTASGSYPVAHARGGCHHWAITPNAQVVGPEPAASDEEQADGSDQRTTAGDAAHQAGAPWAAVPRQAAARRTGVHPQPRQPRHRRRGRRAERTARRRPGPHPDRVRAAHHRRRRRPGGLRRAGVRERGAWPAATGHLAGAHQPPHLRLRPGDRRRHAAAARGRRVVRGPRGLAGDARRDRLGGLMVATGMGYALATADTLAAAGSALLAIAATTAGLVLILGPWILRLYRALTEERRERIRSAERAEMAAHLHDSVLHTLALIQRADAPMEVVTLARRQERELRSWLYGQPAPLEQERLGTAVEALASRVEELHAIAVDVVVVGDEPLDERSRAVVLACQEAAVNAARHSGVTNVSVYVEAEPDGITAYVRDEGKGFDPDAVPPDRRGIRDSIRGRIERQGGTVTITSEPGGGTEVALHLPRERR